MSRTEAGDFSSTDDMLDRIFDRLGGRTGLQFVWVLVAITWTLGIVGSGMANVILTRYLELSSPERWRMLVFSEFILVTGTLAALVGSARIAHPLHMLSERSAAMDVETVALIPDRIFLWNTLVAVGYVVPALMVQMVLQLRPDVPLLLGILIAVLEIVALVNATGLMFMPAHTRVIMQRIKAVDRDAPVARSVLGVRLRLMFAVLPTGLAAADLGVWMGAGPDVSHRQLLANLVVAALALMMYLLVMAVLLARSAVRPLRDLTAGAERIKRSEYSLPVPETSTDEFGVLARTLNEAMEGLADRQRLVVEVRASRTRIVTAADESRKRIERNIHDGAQQRLVALALDLRMLEEQAPALSSGELASALRRTGDGLKEALSELRELARGLHPSVLAADGLSAAIEQLASHASIPVAVDVLGTRFPEAVETACYFTVAEALANVAKYAGATEAAVCIKQQDGRVRLQVSDDGCGGADPKAGSGLTGLVDRIAALDGTLTVDSPPGVGTTLTVELPVITA